MPVRLGPLFPGGIHHDDIDTAGFCRLDRIEGDGGGIAGFLGDHGHVVAFPPYRQLLSRRRPEGIARGE